MSRARRALIRAYANRRSGTRRLAAFGAGSVIVPPATINCPDRIEIGAGVLVGPRTSFFLVRHHGGRDYEPYLRLGDGTLVGNDVWFSCVGEIDIGDQVLIGHGVLIADSFHEYTDRRLPVIGQPMAEPRPVRVGFGASIGPGAALLSGCQIGEGSYIAANAVVTGEIPPFSVVAGNPGAVIRRWDQEGEKWVDDPDPRWAGILGALTGDQVAIAPPAAPA